VRDRIRAWFVQTAALHIEQQLNSSDLRGLSLTGCTEVAELLIEADAAHDRAKCIITAARAQGLAEVSAAVCSHELEAHNTTADYWTCNECGEEQVKGATLYGCRLCDYDQCEKCYRKVDMQMRKHGLPQLASAASLRLLGLVHNHNGEYSQALHLFEEAKLILEDADAEQTSEYAAVLRCIGHYRMQQGDLEDALELLRGAEAMYRQQDISGPHATLRFAELLRSQGVIQIKRRLFKAARERCLTAQKYTADAGAEHSPVYGHVLRNLGQICEEEGHLKEALEYYAQAQTIYEAAAVNRSPKYAVLLRHIGSVHLKRGDVESAMAHYIDAQSKLQLVGAQRSMEYARLLKEIGSCFESDGDDHAALMHFSQARTIIRQAGMASNPECKDTTDRMTVCSRRLLPVGLSGWLERARLSLRRNALRTGAGALLPSLAPLLAEHVSRRNFRTRRLIYAAVAMRAPSGSDYM
jgi:tetratricopeptide (TPR) repeat protein